MQKKQKYNINSKIVKNLLIPTSLVTLSVTGLFGFNIDGKFLSNNKDSKLLLKPISGLSDEQYDKFILGRSFFTIPWVESPSTTTARDGLGPLYDSNTCVSCHPNNGRGNLLTKDNLASRNLIIKVSQKPKDTIEDQTLLNSVGFVPHNVYGNQISINGVHGVPFEGKAKLDFEEIEIKFPDGEIDTILKPKYSLYDLNYGTLDNAILSYRLAPSLNGMGLISLIDEKDILNNVDIDDVNNDGISGKANYVYSKITKKVELGKYTWKASVSRLDEQVANAANNDMGLTTTVNRNENCTQYQKECLDAPKAKDEIDIPDDRLQSIAYYLKNIKVYSAKEDENYKKGLELFKEVGCVKCHISSFDTKYGKVKPFSDFLLHDMGEGLADGFSEFKANGNEFRTAPLWGLSLHEKINSQNPRLLHDGRARNFQEAILWHGGEASGVKENYMNLTKEKREELISFLEGL